MEERSQGAIEYLMMLAAALVIVAGVVHMLFSTSSGLGSTAEDRIDNIHDTIIEILT